MLVSARAGAEIIAGAWIGAGAGTRAGVEIQEGICKVRVGVALLLVGAFGGPSASLLSTGLASKWLRRGLQ